MKGCINDRTLAFTHLFRNQVSKLTMSDEDIARELKISLFTFRRWMAGESAPHPFGYKSVFSVLDRLVSRRTTMSNSG